MKPIEFAGANTVIAKDQKEYFPLPARLCEGGRVLFCWQLTLRERFLLLFSGVIWHQVLTFKRPLQPQLLTIEKPKQ